jgi:hypothetical protein
MQIVEKYGYRIISVLVLATGVFFYLLLGLGYLVQLSGYQ